MREILFRAKRMDNGEWVEGNLIFSNDAEEGWEAIIIPITNSNMFTKGETKGNLGFENWHRVDPETVGQFTGMIDKNGAKVFEGDIIRIITFGFDKELFVTNVKFGARSGVQGFYLANGRSMFYFGQTDLSRMDDGEVIGNIFDNPELLKGGAE